MKIHFLGTVGWHPNGERQTACVMIPELGIVFDAGTGFFRVSKLTETNELHIFLSHYHWDHIIGLWTLPRLGLEAKQIKEVHIYGKPPIRAVSDLAADPHSPPKHQSVPFTVAEHELADREQVTIGITTVQTLHAELHPNDGSRGYRLESGACTITYMTDMTVTDAMLPLAQDADLLICEANFAHKDLELAKQTGHTTAKQAAEFAKRANVKQLALFHVNALEKYFPAQEFLAEALETFPNTVLSEDELILTI